MKNKKIHTYIREVIKEVITELNVTDPDLRDRINSLAEMHQRIIELKEELTVIQNSAGEIEDEIRPLLEEMQVSGQRLLKTEEYIAYIAKMGESGRVRYKYEQAYKLALTKVNKATQAILKEALEANQTVSRVLSKIAVSRPENLPKTKKKEFGIEESFISDIWKKFKGWVRSKVNKIKNSNDVIADVNQELRNIVKGLK